MKESKEREKEERGGNGKLKMKIATSPAFPRATGMSGGCGGEGELFGFY